MYLQLTIKTYIYILYKIQLHIVHFNSNGNL